MRKIYCILKPGTHWRKKEFTVNKTWNLPLDEKTQQFIQIWRKMNATLLHWQREFLPHLGVTNTQTGLTALTDLRAATSQLYQIVVASLLPKQWWSVQEALDNPEATKDWSGCLHPGKALRSKRINQSKSTNRWEIIGECESLYVWFVQ